MKLLKNRGVAVFLCFVMIIMALWIGRWKQQTTVSAPEYETEIWGEENYGAYLRYISDETDLLEQEAAEQIAQINASLDFSYDSICGLGIVNQFEDADIADAAYAFGEQLGLGERDFLLFLDLQSADWYFACGSEAEEYVDHALEIVVTSHMDQVFTDPSGTLPVLYEDLRSWYGTLMPTANPSERKSSSGMVISGVIIMVLLIVFLVIVASVSALLRASRRVVGRFRTGIPYIHINRRPHHSGYRPPRPGPGPGPRPGPTYRSQAKPRSSSGFGGSSRGSFRGGGGFGGSSRGGGFGKK